MSLQGFIRRLLGGSRGIVGLNRRNIEFVIPENPRSRFPDVDDKVKTKSILLRAGVPVPQTYGVIAERRRIAIGIESLRRFESCVVKPSRSYGGQGLLVLQRVGDSWKRPGGKWCSAEDLRFHIGMILGGMFSFDQLADRVLIERRLEDHPEIAKVHRTGSLSDVRLICYRGDVVMGMLRMPTIDSEGVANLHAGGIGIGIDLESGETTSAVQNGRAWEFHPDTGMALHGFRLPYWAEMLEIGLKVNDCFGMGFLGIDIAVEAGGPRVLEVNARPGLSIQLANRQGLLEAIVRRTLEPGGREPPAREPDQLTHSST